MGIKSILAISLFAVLLIGMISFDDTFAAMCSEVSDESSCTAISFCGWEDNMCVISLPTTGTIEVTKDVLPSTIDLAGSAGQEITTITIDVAGYSIDQNMETVFLMDASGSVGSSGWNMVKDFVVDIINTGIPESDPIGIVRFSTPTLTQIIWDFADDQDRDVLTNVVAGLAFTQGTTATRDALERAVDIFEQTGNISDDVPRLVFLITDGNPYPLREQNPCDSTAEAEALRADLELYDIKVIIIGVGSNLNTSILSCLVDDEAVDIIEVSSFDSFDSIRNQIDSQILAANAPSNVNLIETTQTHIVDESVFSIAPDSITTLPGGQTQMTWNDIAQHVGNSDNKLSIDESFSVSFNAKSNLVGVDLEVNDLAESSVSFIDHNGVATSVGLPQALITVLIDTDGDTILDHLDNCPFDANLDQADLDGDLIGDACDADDDNDGVLDSNDIDPFDPNVCQDSDNDTCDDCSIGSDGLGPLVDFDIANDGPDFDSDTVCDAGDPDVDGDNILGATDCNDLDPSIGGPITWYADTDGDSFGDPNNSQLACEIPDHFVPIAGDCLDTDFGVKPGATEVLDGLDNDCDGATDEGFTDPDNDFVDSSDDNCPDDANADQLNTDGDEAGDACDVCPADIDNDSDGDGLCLDVDVCPLDSFNDADNDGVCGDVDACPDEFGDGTDGCTIIPPTPVPTSTDHYLAYDVKETKHTDKFEKMTLTLTDQFETDAVYKVEKPHHLYNPVDKNGEGISDEISHMVGYKIKEPKGDPKFEKVTDVLVQNQFGDIIVDVKKPKLLLVPSAKDHFTVPDELNPITINHFKCYDVKESKDTPKFVKRTVTVYDPNFEITKDFEIKKPKQLCTPVDKNGEGIVDVENYLMCYDLKKMKGEPKFEKRNVFTNNQFGHDDLEVKKQHQLCVPSKILP